MGLFRSGDVIGIADDALTFALEASRETHPDEYMGLLRGERAREFDLTHEGLLVTDVLIIPGTESNPISATVKTSMIPNDFSSVGSVHSHPNGVLQPSQADLATFGKGQVHIIVGHPYGRDDWVALDREGKRRSLPVYDVDMGDDEEFFDFTQADIDAELGIDEDER